MIVQSIIFIVAFYFVGINWSYLFTVSLKTRYLRLFLRFSAIKAGILLIFTDVLLPFGRDRWSIEQSMTILPVISFSISVVKAWVKVEASTFAALLIQHSNLISNSKEPAFVVLGKFY